MKWLSELPTDTENRGGSSAGVDDDIKRRIVDTYMMREVRLVNGEEATARPVVRVNDEKKNVRYRDNVGGVQWGGGGGGGSGEGRSGRAAAHARHRHLPERGGRIVDPNTESCHHPRRARDRGTRPRGRGRPEEDVRVAAAAAAVPLPLAGPDVRCHISSSSSSTHCTKAAR